MDSVLVVFDGKLAFDGPFDQLLQAAQREKIREEKEEKEEKEEEGEEKEGLCNLAGLGSQATSGAMAGDVEEGGEGKASQAKEKEKYDVLSLRTVLDGLLKRNQEGAKDAEDAMSGGGAAGGEAAKRKRDKNATRALGALKDGVLGEKEGAIRGGIGCKTVVTYVRAAGIRFLLPCFMVFVLVRDTHNNSIAQCNSLPPQHNIFGFLSLVARFHSRVYLHNTLPKTFVSALSSTYTHSCTA